MDLISGLHQPLDVEDGFQGKRILRLRTFLIWEGDCRLYLDETRYVRGKGLPRHMI